MSERRGRSGRGLKLNQRIAHVTSRLHSHRIALGLVVAAIGGFLAYIAWISINGPPFQNRYELHVMVPSDSPILQPGDAVRVAGRLAGFVTDVAPAPEQDAVDVTTELRPNFAPVGLDARSNVKVRSLVYLTYLELFPGDRSKPMPEGGTIPVERSSSGVDLLEVVQLFDQKARETIRNSTVAFGNGVAGRGTDLNAAFADLDQTAVAGTKELQALTSQPGAIARGLNGAAHTFRGLEGSRPDDVAALIGAGSVALQVIADHRSQLGESLELLRPFEDEVLATAPLAEPLLRDSVPLTEELGPLVADVNRALPDVNALLSRGEELRTETMALTALADPLFKELGPQVAALYPTVASIEPLLDAVNATVDQILPYEREINLAGDGLVGATSTTYPEGQTHPGTTALRFAPVLTCAGGRNPFPSPGTTLGQSQAC